MRESCLPIFKIPAGCLVSQLVWRELRVKVTTDANVAISIYEGSDLGLWNSVSLIGIGN